MHQVNHLNLQQNIELKYMINQEGRIIPIVTLGLKLQS